MEQKIVKNRLMQAPDGAIHIVKEVKEYIPAQSFSGTHWIAIEPRLELADGTPVKQTAEGEFMVPEEEHEATAHFASSSRPISNV